MADLHEDVAALVRETRERLLPFWGNVGAVYSKARGSMDAVTDLDIETEKFLCEGLAKLDPSIAFFGEELGGVRDAERFWLCDPIDGTLPFIRGLPFATVMLALIERGTVTRSFIYDFVNDDLYHARLGGGAYRNEERIRVSDRFVTDSCIGWEMHAEKPENWKKYIDWTFKGAQVSPVMRLLCAGYEFALVASGKLDGRVQFDPYGRDWDFAPGSLLVSEAGGAVANIGTTTYDYTNVDFIAANPRIYKALTSGPEAIFPIS